MKDFSQKVCQAVQKIPKGKVVTYGQIAKILGKPGAARAVGNALHQNPNPKVIPCHRVVNKEGKLAVNFGLGGAKVQKRKLLAEGVLFKDRLHIDLSKSGFYGRLF